MIGESGAPTRRCFEAFLANRHFDPIEFQGARIPVYSRWIPATRNVGGGSVYLVGDAAGQIKVSTVGGIVTGLRGAIGAVQAILSGGTSRELRALRRELDLHHFQQPDYSRMVAYTRDEVWKILWKVCLSQPRLMLLGLYGVLLRRAAQQRAL